MPTKRDTTRYPLTKKAFERLLTKAAQPLPKSKLAPKENGTSIARPSDDYNETHKNLGKIGDTEVSQND